MTKLWTAWERLHFRLDFKKRWLAYLASGLLLVAFVGCNSNETSFKEKCVAAGGHQYGTGLLLCLSEDGRVVEVYP